MDRIASLIQEIKEAHEQEAEASVMLSLVQELQTLLYQEILPTPSSGKRIAVMMPQSVHLPEDFKFKSSASEIIGEEEKVVEVLQVDEEALEAELKQIKENAAFAQQMKGKQSKLTPGLLFDWEDDIAELPTLVHQPETPSVSSELSPAGEHGIPSVNDQLAIHKKEVADQLGTAPIKDLKKAIGINDRFLFIQELFRGDETMYERSIKTINNFTIYAEAQYWIERELKVKLSWDNEKSVTQDFYNLVKRRFA
jgi:hypothetical protein